MSNEIANEMSNTEAIRQYVAGLKVAGLREELKKHNQPTHGNKAALGQRLQETLEYEDGGAGEDAAAMEAEDGKEGEAVAAGGEEGGEEEGGENAVGIQANGAVGGTFEDPSASGMASFHQMACRFPTTPRCRRRRRVPRKVQARRACVVCAAKLCRRRTRLSTVTVPASNGCTDTVLASLSNSTRPSVTVAAPTSARAAAASGSRGK